DWRNGDFKTLVSKEASRCLGHHQRWIRRLEKSVEDINGETEEAFGGDGDTPAPLELGVSVTEMENESSSKVAVSQEVRTGGAAGAAGARISSGVVISDLIGELEATAGSLVKNLGCEGSKSHQEPLLTDWSLPQGRRHHSPPKTVRIDGKTISPGRFQGPNQNNRGKNKSGWRPIANTKDLILAALNIGCLVETRVHEGHFKKVVEATFPGWSYTHNYAHHRLGRIWVCWSDDVEVVHVSSSAQMITCWVRYKSSCDFFLNSFVYGFNGASERRDLWQEMEMISNSVVGNTYPWILQGDFNVALSMEEHSRATTTGGDRRSISEFQEAVRVCG
ncbi:LOW QUALITY PROTEIN: hypothetical protein HID58_006511, partial [Brassica napus]